MEAGLHRYAMNGQGDVKAHAVQALATGGPPVAISPAL